MVERRIRKDNKTGIKGVSRRGTRWTAYCRLDGLLQYGGSYPCPLLAQNAYLKMVSDYKINKHYRDMYLTQQNKL